VVGLGLPSELYEDVVELLEGIEEEINCGEFDDNTTPYCTIPNPCNQYTVFSNYSFQLNFTGATNYVRVPLGVFAQTSGTSCNLYVQDIGTSKNNVIIGAMFFQEFYGAFSNNYMQGNQQA